MTLLSTHPLEEASICPQIGPSYSRRSSQATRGKLHQRSLLPQLVGKRGNGQELWDNIKISQIKIHLIKNVEKYIGTCITKFLSHIVRKLNPSPIIKMPHDEFCLSSPLECIAFLLILLFEQSLQLSGLVLIF